MKKILPLILILSFFFTCNKDDEPTPKTWTEEDNIFRCKINGTDWEPEGDGISFSGGNLDIYYEKNFLNAIQIRASRDIGSESDFMSMLFSVKTEVTGEHDILDSGVFTDYNCGNYYRDTLAQNIVNIVSIDSINNILEGTFYFEANEGSTSTCTVDKIIVTDGYFKAKYRS